MPERRPIVLHERAAGANQRVFAHELLLMLLYGVSCWLVGRRIPILRTEFSYRGTRPQRGVSPDVLLRSAFRQIRIPLIAFEASYLDLPVVQNERSLKEFLRTAPESILLKYKNSSSLAARVRRRLRQFLPGEVADFEQLADELNMTAATCAGACTKKARRINRSRTSCAAILPSVT
jgi:hypothetical protein